MHFSSEQKYARLLNFFTNHLNEYFLVSTSFNIFQRKCNIKNFDENEKSLIKNYRNKIDWLFCFFSVAKK